MTRMMFGPLVLFAASVSAISPAGPPTAQRGAQPTVRATAMATASITIISGVRFGPDHLSGAEGADRRKSVLVDADGVERPAELLEFQ